MALSLPPPHLCRSVCFSPHLSILPWSRGEKLRCSLSGRLELFHSWHSPQACEFVAKVLAACYSMASFLSRHAAIAAYYTVYIIGKVGARRTLRRANALSHDFRSNSQVQTFERWRGRVPASPYLFPAVDNKATSRFDPMPAVNGRWFTVADRLL